MKRKIRNTLGANYSDGIRLWWFRAQEKEDQYVVLDIEYLSIAARK